MKLVCVVLLTFFATAIAKRCSVRKTNSKLICYYSDVKDIDACMCTHIILPANSNFDTIDSVQGQFKDIKVFLTVHEFNQDLVNILKNSKVHGLEISLKKINDKNDVPDFISTVKSKLGSDLRFAIAIPPKAELLAKHYDLKALTKHADLFILQTAFLGASQNVTFHPSRLSGLWDMQNTDSVVDLVTGMGAPLSKLVISSPVQAFQFTLQDESYTAPGSPALDITSITREQLCRKMSKGSNWTLERDQDQAGPYIFRKNTWIAFDDPTSIDIKAKYTRIRGLAGLALKDLSQDGGKKCGVSLLEAAYTGLSRQSRAPRGAVLQSLEREILETPARPLDTIQISPYRISRVIDVEGNVHSIRQDTRTEFECARQGYFVHPRSCGRFFRCVKFDQLADDFSVFEFDCPAGLSFDSRYEVCVWPGSLPYSSPCSGSSEIAPVPRTRFICPGAEGYYADPENCRWFFACLDHGKSPLSAYEFRCPFGLVFDEGRLVCEWPWLVPKCGSGSAVGFEYGNQVTIGAARLETYNGLGALGVVNLGGLSGPLVQPQAKIYSSVSNVHNGLLQNQEHLQRLDLSHGAINSGITQGTAGLSHATINGFSNQNSGLGILVGSNGFGHGLNQNNAAIIAAQNSAQFHGNAGASLQGAQGIIGTVQGGSYQTNIDFGKDALNIQHGSGLSTGSAHGVNLVQDGGFGLKTTNVVNHGITLQQPVVPVVSLSSSNGSSAYHQANLQNNLNNYKAVVNVAPLERIHIIGGFSAVGAGGKSVSELSQNNLNINDIPQVAPLPPSALPAVSIVSPSPVPAVAAVPVPVVKSDTDIYEAGVVANVPELQYKIVTPSASNVYFQSDLGLSRGLSGITNVSQDFINLISSTPSSIALPTTPVLSFVQSSTVRPIVNVGQTVVHGGYNYPRPKITFDETPASVTRLNLGNAYSTANKLLVTNTYVTPKPFAVQSVQPAVVSSFSVNSIQKPLDVVQPVVSVTPAAPVAQQIYHVQPVITPTVGIVEQNVKPAVVSSYSFQNAVKTQGQHDSKVLVQPFVRVNPSVPLIQERIQPAVATVASNYNIHSSNEGYIYSKPQVAFEEKPAVVSSFSINSNQKPLAVVQPTVSVATITEHKVVQPIQHNIVQPVQPLVRVNPVVPVEHRVVQHPQPVVSVTPVVPITQQKIQSAFTSSYQSQDFANHGGYEYSRPPVSLVEPLVSVTPSSATVSRFSFQNIAHNQGYNYNRQLSPVQSVVSVTPATPIIKETLHQRPAIVSNYNFQNAFNNQGYQSFKQTIPVVSVTQTVPIVQQPVQPAVVSSYSFQPVVKNNYSKAQVPLQPLVSVTPATTIVKQDVNSVQPAVVSSYNFQNAFNNQGYQSFKQTIPVVSVTETVPIVQQPVQPAVVSSYSFQPVVKNDYNKQQVSLQPLVSVTPATTIVKQDVNLVQPAVLSSYSFQNGANNENYKYKETKQLLLQQPVGSVTPIAPTQPAVVSSFSIYNKQVPLQPFVSVTPSVPIIEEKIQPVQPAIVSSYRFQNVDKSESYKNVQQLLPLVSVTPRVPIIKQNIQPVQPAVVSSFSFTSADNNEGYTYNKPVQPLQPFVSVTPSVPVIAHQVQSSPTVVYNYNFQSVAKNQHQRYQETLQPLQPVVSVTPTVPIIQERVQPILPAVVSSYRIQNVDNRGNYEYTKQLPLQPVVHVTPAPTIPTIIERLPTVQPAVVSSYSFNSVSNNDGYKYSKATVPVQPIQTVPVVTHKTVQTVKLPAVSNYNYESVIRNDYVKPVAVQSVVSVTPVVPIAKQPAVISSYTFSSAANQASFGAKSTQSTFSDNSEGYVYHKPSIAFEEGPAQSVAPLVSVSTVAPVIPQKIQYTTHQQFGQPAVSTYNFQNSVATKNENYNYVESKVRPVLPAVVSTFNIRTQPKPVVAFEQRPVFAVTTPAVPIIEQNVVPIQPINGDFGVKLNYKPVQPTIDYSNRQPVQEEPFVARKTYLTTNQQNTAEIGYSYSRPKVTFEERPAVIQQYSTPVVTSTLQYDEVALPVNPFQQYVQSSQSSRKNTGRGRVIYSTTPTIVEDYYYTTPKPIYISTPTPFTRTKSRSRVDSNAYNVYSSTPRPRYTSTVAAVIANKPQPFGEFSYYDSRLQTAAVPVVTSTLGQYQTSIPTSTIRPILTSIPTKGYVDDFIEVSTPSREYLPSKLVDEEYVIKTKELSKPKTYVRVNDFHPLLPAKLGAQCTCKSTSNTLTLRRKPVAAPIPLAYETVDIDDDNDGYVVKPQVSQNVNIPTRSGGVVLENYVYEPSKIVDITPSPPVFIKSTTNSILPAPAPAITKARVRVRPVTTPATVFSSVVTQVPEIFLKKTVAAPTVAIYKAEESRPSEQEIADVVNKGLNIVKSTIKGAVKEALNEHAFDRYGPGGWRSRDETLQGTIDCQRPGLFRHPEQCNKFYACRWDCTKNRYTLHVFNCPVYLTFDPNLAACNWPSQGPACAGNTLLPNE